MTDVPQPEVKRRFLGDSVPRLSHRAMAYAQISLSVLFTSGYFYVLIELIHGKVAQVQEVIPIHLIVRESCGA